MYNDNLFFDKKYEIKGMKFDTQIIEWSKKFESLMSIEQKRFLMSIISEKKKKNVLEIGVWNGVSSLCILKSGLEVNNDFCLYSIDFSNDDNFIGEAVKAYCSNEEIKHYNLNLNKTVFDIENIIPKDIKFDLVFIDAGHSHPFPLFDLIFSIPYMNKNTIIILHDIIDYMRPNAWGESFIFESWTGDKYRIYKDIDKKLYSSMGCIKLHNTEEELYDNIKIISNIDLRANPWAVDYYKTVKGRNDIDNQYKNNGLGFNLDDLLKLKKYVEKNYSVKFSDELYTILVNNYKKYMENCYLYMHETRFFNYLYENYLNSIKKINSLGHDISQFKKDNDLNKANIYDLLNQEILKLKKENIYLKSKLNDVIDLIAWWIPVKKWRDNFRVKFKIETRPDQTRPDQTRPDQTKYVKSTYNFIIIQKLKNYNLCCIIKKQHRFFIA